MNEITGNPVFGVALTLGVYALAMAAHSRVKWAHPLLTTCGVLYLVLRLLHIQPQQYQLGGSMISFFLGPATIALGVPMYKQANQLKKSLPVLSVGVIAGAVVGMITAGVTAALLGAPPQLVMSCLPKSVTTPIAMEVSRQLHGVPEVSASMAIIAGIVGSLIGPSLLRRVRVSNHMAVGAAMGTSSHALGTARVLRDSEVQGSTASLAMAMAGITTALLAMAVPWIMRHIPFHL
jgi:predicted murein hydrolase (TIGR00659 family)